MADLIPAARERTIIWQQGDDSPAVITVPGPTGASIDVTGWTAVAAVFANGAEVHRWSTLDGSAVAGADGVQLLADDSSDWNWSRGRYDVRVWAPDGTRRVVGFGDMLVRPVLAESTERPAKPVAPPGTLVMCHGDSWRPRSKQPSSPRFALHQGGVALPLDAWWVRAQARQAGASRPLFSWCAHLSALAGTGVEVDTARYRRTAVVSGPPDPTKPEFVDLPAMWMRLDVDDWEGKPREWEGSFEVELTRGSLSDPLERTTIPSRPLIIVPDLIP